MPFEDALVALKLWQKVSRIQFKNTCYIQAQLPDQNSKNTIPYLQMVKGDNVFPLDLSCESLFANDWYVLD